MNPGRGVQFAKRFAPVKLLEWQLAILHGMFAHRFSIIVIPSGYGKTLLAAIHVAATLIGEDRRIRSYGIAGDIEQAGLLDQALGEVFDHPELRRLVSLLVKISWPV